MLDVIVLGHPGGTLHVCTGRAWRCRRKAAGRAPYPQQTQSIHREQSHPKRRLSAEALSQAASGRDTSLSCSLGKESVLCVHFEPANKQRAKVLLQSVINS